SRPTKIDVISASTGIALYPIGTREGKSRRSEGPLPPGVGNRALGARGEIVGVVDVDAAAAEAREAGAADGLGDAALGGGRGGAAGADPGDPAAARQGEVDADVAFGLAAALGDGG